MRYCGNCGGSFDPATLTGRTCPQCGAAINRTGDIEFSDAWDGAQEQTQAPRSASGYESFSASPTAPAYGFGFHNPRSMTIDSRATRTHAFRPVALLALVALALLLVFGSALLLNNAPGHLRAGSTLLPFGGANSAQTATTSSTSSQGTQPSPTGGSQSGGPLATPIGSSTAGVLTPSASADITPTPEGSPTTTPEPGQPALTVTPAQITIAVCLGSSAHFTVTNTGNGVMAWNASASRPAYKLSPQSGSLDSGQQQSVTVSGISASGSITIVALGAANSPQTVTITCTL